MKQKVTSFVSNTRTNPTFKRLSFIVSIHAIIPAILLIALLSWGQREVAKNVFENNMLQIASYTANAYRNELLKTKQLLTVLSSLPEIQTQNKKYCQQVIELIVKSEPNKIYSNLGAVNENGDNFCSFLPIHNQVNISNRPNFIAARETKRFVIGNFLISSLNKKAIITASQPILNEQDQFKGIVFASIDLTWFKKLAENVKIPAEYTLTVIDKNAVTISRYPSYEKWVGKNIKDTDLGKSLISQGNSEGTFIANGLDNTRRLYAYSTISDGLGGKVYIVIGTPTTELTKFANQSLLKNSVILLLIISLAVLICAFDMHLIFKKIKVGVNDRAQEEV